MKRKTKTKAAGRKTELPAIYIRPVEVRVKTRFESSMNRNGATYGDELVELIGFDRTDTARKLRGLADHLLGTWSDNELEARILCVFSRMPKP